METTKEFYAELDQLLPQLVNRAGYAKNDPVTQKKLGEYCLAFQKQVERFKPHSFVSFDLETTGLGFSNDFLLGKQTITEVAGVRLSKRGAYKGRGLTKAGLPVKSKKEFDEFQTLINDGLTIPQHVEELTGITNEMINEEGVPSLKEAVQAFLDYTDGALLFGHNVGCASFNKRGFDVITVLGPIVERLELGTTEELLERTFDTLPLVKALCSDLPTNKNADFAGLFGLVLVDAHRALPDVRVNAIAFSKLFSLLLKAPAEALIKDADERLQSELFKVSFVQAGGLEHERWCEVGVVFNSGVITKKGDRKRTVSFKYYPDRQEWSAPRYNHKDGTVTYEDRFLELVPLKRLEQLVAIHSKKSFEETAQENSVLVF